MTTRKTICKLVRDFMLTKDPYGFQSHEICSCSYLCRVQTENDNENYFPKNYDEYVKVRNVIIEDNNFLKKNLQDDKGS